MRRSCNKSTHAKNLHVEVTNIKKTQRHSNNFRRQPLHGFTLVELLVVISIIALLVSILLPALGKAREQAREVRCQVHLKQIGTAVIAYVTDNDDFYPFHPQLDLNVSKMWNPSNNYGIESLSLGDSIGFGMLYPNYIGEPHIFYCLNTLKDSNYEKDWSGTGRPLGYYYYGWRGSAGNPPFKFSKVKPELCLSTDRNILHDVGVMGWGGPYIHRKGFNRLGADSSVRWMEWNEELALWNFDYLDHPYLY